MDNSISIGEGALWVLAWFGVMLLYTALDVAVWRKIAPSRAKLLNVITVALCMGGFLALLRAKLRFPMDIVKGTSLQGIILAIVCAAALYFLLDKFLDPVFERMLPGSEERYQETLRSLSEAPVISLIQICILAPVMEEILMRGLLLGGLSIHYGKVTALLVSSAFFALLHFNMVQTLSAFLCGVVLGLLYIRTGSLLCCMVTHMGYNLISYLATILPLIHKKGA